MSPVRLAILAGALVAALIAAFVVRGIAVGRPKPVAIVAPVAKPTLMVLVAARDLAVGDRLVPQDLTWQAWPADGVNPAYVTNGPAAVAPRTEAAKLTKAASGMATAVMGSDQAPMQPFLGAAVREAIMKGEPIMQTKVVRAGDAGVLAVTLSPGLRAMAVPLSAESAAGGFILPGDHVDVVQSRQADAALGGKGFVSTTVLNNVKVLAIDQNTRALKQAQAVIGATATLEVSPRQAELLAAYKAQGQLTLVLRSYADIDGPAFAGGSTGGMARTPVVHVFRNASATDVVVAR